MAQPNIKKKKKLIHKNSKRLGSSLPLSGLRDPWRGIMVGFPQPEGSGHCAGCLPQHKRHQNLDSLRSAGCSGKFPHSQAVGCLSLLLLEAKPAQVSRLIVFSLPCCGPEARATRRQSTWEEFTCVRVLPAGIPGAALLGLHPGF